MDQTLINRIVDAALLAANQPLTVVQLRGLFTLDAPAPDGTIEQALHDLQAACVDRGVELVEVASGWRYQVRGDVHAWVARLWTERQTRYTRATLETLALIAYRQPITRGEIEQVRGVATNSNIIKALEEREWIRVVGHRDMPGRPELLGTTKTFLDYFGLKRLDELPPLSELKDFGELEPQLDLGKDDDTGQADGDTAAMPVGDTPLDDADAAAGADDPTGADDDVDAAQASPTATGDSVDTASDADDPPSRDDTVDIDVDTTRPTETTADDADSGTAASSQPETDTALADDGDSTRSQ